MHGPLRRFGFAVLVALLAVGAVYVARVVAHELTVDSCFDAGGVYIERLQKCSHSQDEVDSYLPKRH